MGVLGFVFWWGRLDLDWIELRWRGERNLLLGKGVLVLFELVLYLC